MIQFKKYIRNTHTEREYHAQELIMFHTIDFLNPTIISVNQNITKFRVHSHTVDVLHQEYSHTCIPVPYNKEMCNI